MFSELTEGEYVIGITLFMTDHSADTYSQCLDYLYISVIIMVVISNCGDCGKKSLGQSPEDTK